MHRKTHKSNENQGNWMRNLRKLYGKTHKFNENKHHLTYPASKLQEKAANCVPAAPGAAHSALRSSASTASEGWRLKFSIFFDFMTLPQLAKR